MYQDPEPEGQAEVVMFDTRKGQLFRRVFDSLLLWGVGPMGGAMSSNQR